MHCLVTVRPNDSWRVVASCADRVHVAAPRPRRAPRAIQLRAMGAPGPRGRSGCRAAGSGTIRFVSSCSPWPITCPTFRGNGAAPAGADLDADDAPGDVDQDRGQVRPPRQGRHVPVGPRVIVRRGPMRMTSSRSPHPTSSWQRPDQGAPEGADDCPAPKSRGRTPRRFPQVLPVAVRSILCG